MRPGLTEILLVVLLVVILFGAKRIPDLAKGVGEGIRNFKTALKDEQKPEEKKQA